MLLRAGPAVRGRGSVAQRLQRRTVTHGEWRIAMKRGHAMRVPRTSAATWVPAFTGRYDDEHLDWIERWLEADTFVLDVGACFGPRSTT